MDSRLEAKLRRVEKASINLDDAFRAKFNQGIALETALDNVAQWLDVRGIGMSSAKGSPFYATDKMILKSFGKIDPYVVGLFSASSFFTENF